MQVEIAQVVSVANGTVEVTTKIQSTCGKCEQQSHCGTGLLARYLAPKPENLKLKSQLQLVPGQQIKIGLSETLMLKLACLIYLMPVLLLLLSASVFSLLLPTTHEGWHILLSLALCTGYFTFLRSLMLNGRIHLGEPKILQVFSEQDIPVRLHIPS